MLHGIFAVCPAGREKKKQAAVCGPLGVRANATGSISRVLSSTAIYLDPGLLPGSSHLLGTAGQADCPSHGVAPDRVYSTPMFPWGGCALTAPFHPYLPVRKAVSFCCTCPRVTPGGRYPLSLPCGARTFLTGSLSASPRGCPTRSRSYCSGFRENCQSFSPAAPRRLRTGFSALANFAESGYTRIIEQRVLRGIEEWYGKWDMACLFGAVASATAFDSGAGGQQPAVGPDAPGCRLPGDRL